MFHVAGFPEMGVKVGALCRTKVPLLSGSEDHVFQDVQERKIKVRISVSAQAPKYFSSSEFANLT